MKPYEEQYFYPKLNNDVKNRFNNVHEETAGVFIDDNRRAPSPPVDVIYAIGFPIYVKKSSCPHLDELLRASPVECKEIRYIDNKKIEYAYWKVTTLLDDDEVDPYRLWQPYMDLELSEYHDKNVYDCAFTTDRMGSIIRLDFGPRYRRCGVFAVMLDAKLFDQLPVEQRLIFSLRSKMGSEMYFHESILPIFTSIHVSWRSIAQENEELRRVYNEQRQEEEEEDE